MTTPPPDFTSHNVALPDGTHTRPGAPLLADTGICKAALRTLDLVFPDADAVADLGCLEGGYAAEFARAGFRVFGVEGRADNYACCEHVRHHLGLPNLHFVHADVRDYVPGRCWDAVFCCGLLYHLDYPVKFLHQLADATGRVLILGTHYSLVDDTEHEGVPGCWTVEGTDRWASCGNPASFWLTKPALIRTLRQAGFTTVFEQLDHIQDGQVYVDHHGLRQEDRGLFVAVKD